MPRWPFFPSHISIQRYKQTCTDTHMNDGDIADECDKLKCINTNC